MGRFAPLEIAQYSSSVSLLYIFAEKNLPTLIRRELDRLPHMDIRGERYVFPLGAAIAHRNEAAIREFLTPASQDGIAAVSSLTAPHAGMSQLLFDPVAYLLRHKARITPYDREAETILFWALGRGKGDLFNALLATKKVGLEWSPELDESLLLVISLEMGGGRPVSVKLSWPNRHSIRVPREYMDLALKWARDHCWKLFVRRFLWCIVNADEAWVDLTGRWAAQIEEPLYHDDDLISMINDCTGQHIWDLMNNDCQQLLSLAIKYGVRGLVKQIVRHNLPSTDQARLNPICSGLSTAAKSEDDSMIRLILTETRGNPVIREHVAAQTFSADDKAMFKFLLKNDATLERITIQRRPPLLWAIEEQDERLVRLLLAKGILELDASESAGNDALIMAVREGVESIVGLLLGSEKCDVNGTDVEGNTPLWWAVFLDREPIVELLLETPAIDLGISDHFQNGDILTPIQMAKEPGKRTILEMLQQAEQAARGDTS